MAACEQLDQWSLARLFAECDDKTRAKASLVNKTWHEVEKSHPPEPTHLELDYHAHFTPSYLAWHLRGTGRLTHLRIVDGRLGQVPHVDEGSCQKLADCMAQQAPSLRSLDIQARLEPEAEGRLEELEGGGHRRLKAYWLPLPLVARLTQLVRLRLSDWRYGMQDVADFHLLAELRNLQELSLVNVAASPKTLSEDDSEGPGAGKGGGAARQTAGSELQGVLRRLSQLSKLEVVKVGTGFEGMLPSNLVTCLKRLRCLVIDRSPHIDVTAVGGMTGLTHLAIDVHLMHLQTLFTRLARLQELSIKFYGTAPPTMLALAEGCQLSRLGVAPVDATPLFPPIPKAALEAFLPLEKLATLRALDLGITSLDYWPGSFAPLSGLTFLQIRCQDSVADAMHSIAHLHILREFSMSCKVHMYSQDQVEALLQTLPSLEALALEVFIDGNQPSELIAKAEEDVQEQCTAVAMKHPAVNLRVGCSLCMLGLPNGAAGHFHDYDYF